MSVTITIVGNFEYVDTNCPELIKVTVFDKEIDPEQQEFKEYPFQLNIANGNFVDLWDALYLREEYCGTIEPKELLNRLKGLKLNALVTEQTEEEGRCAIITPGRNLEQLTRYYWTLSKICSEAIKRNALIQWY